MSRTGFGKIALTAVLATLACAAVFAQEAASSEGPVAYDEFDALTADAPYVIFSNLGRTPGERYDPDIGFPVAGEDAFITEQWNAIRFVPKVDVQARVLLAALTYTLGTKLVNLGIYSNNDLTGSVGDPLPGGQGSTSQIPDAGGCCRLAKVTLAGDGVSLIQGTKYWLVAGPDNVSAPDFRGAWQLSHMAAYASFSPDIGWLYPIGQWPAAEIRGGTLQSQPQSKMEESASPGEQPEATNVTIFTNLNRIFDPLFSYGAGVAVNGNDVPFQAEAWRALPFTPRSDVHAKTLAAAVAWVSGARMVRLGVYSDEDGAVGTPLPDGQASTTEIPDLGDCCELARVTLPGSGIALTAGEQYWLVASPDNLRAPTFAGAWQQSSLAVSAYTQPENGVGWTSFSGLWLAAEIRGTSP